LRKTKLSFLLEQAIISFPFKGCYAAAINGANIGPNLKEAVRL